MKMKTKFTLAILVIAFLTYPIFFIGTDAGSANNSEIVYSELSNLSRKYLNVELKTSKLTTTEKIWDEVIKDIKSELILRLISNGELMIIKDKTYTQRGENIVVAKISLPRSFLTQVRTFNFNDTMDYLVYNNGNVSVISSR
jgi:hypothetical protein